MVEVQERELRGGHHYVTAQGQSARPQIGSSSCRRVEIEVVMQVSVEGHGKAAVPVTVVTLPVILDGRWCWMLAAKVRGMGLD